MHDASSFLETSSAGRCGSDCLGTRYCERSRRWLLCGIHHSNLVDGVVHFLVNVDNTPLRACSQFEARMGVRLSLIDAMHICEIDLIEEAPGFSDKLRLISLHPLMQPRHHLSDTAGVVAPDQADLGSALSEGLRAHRVVRVDHPAGELPDRLDRHVPQHLHRQAGQVGPRGSGKVGGWLSDL